MSKVEVFIFDLINVVIYFKGNNLKLEKSDCIIYMFYRILMIFCICLYKYNMKFLKIIMWLKSKCLLIDNFFSF